MRDFHHVPKVWLDFMDRDHEAGIEITNRLMAELDKTSPDQDKITAGLEQLLSHCREHFASEEAEMQSYNFPPYSEHKAEHERVLAELNGELANWYDTYDIDRLRHYFFDVLSLWFLNHTARMDLTTASFIRKARDQSQD